MRKPISLTDDTWSKSELRKYAEDNKSELTELLKTLANPDVDGGGISRADYRQLQSTLKTIVDRLGSIEEAISLIRETLTSAQLSKRSGFGEDDDEQDETAAAATRAVSAIVFFKRNFTKTQYHHPDGAHFGLVDADECVRKDAEYHEDRFWRRDDSDAVFRNRIDRTKSV